MTPPTVQFIPATAVASPDFTISGTLDGISGTAGATDNDPGSVPAISGLSSVILRGTLGAGTTNVVFDNGANRDAFVASVPNGSTAVLTHLSSVYTASSFSWQTFGTTARLNLSEWDALPSSFSPGDDYTLEFYT